tara:strand:- start:22856 stop:24124 length:1269 start_codon:yes stop_codon:yes gene_type:complete
MQLNFENIKLKIIKDGHDSGWESLMSCDNREFRYELSYKSETYEGAGVRGDDALWIPYANNKGLKVIAENHRYQSLQESKEVVDVIKESPCDTFPKIYDNTIHTEVDTGEQFLLIEQENMGPPSGKVVVPQFVPQEHRNSLSSLLQADPFSVQRFIRDLTSLKLCPEDEWYKSINLINGKVVDFHRFTLMPSRYYFAANGKKSQELHKIYRNMVDRYKTVLDPHGLPKWKGMIYQGFAFDNGYYMEGYLSDNDMYDSYRKLPFVPYNKCRDKKVLDIGSNQGFFSFQASIHGATDVLGIELTEQDVAAANDIKEITGIDNVNFINADAIEHVMNTDEHYGLVIMNSVLHQVYPNFVGSEPFLKKLSSITDYFAFETPLNHSTMNLDPMVVQNELQKYFKIVRLLYVYDAYSTGYRANYVCYS